jgi:hypothetical protein
MDADAKQDDQKINTPEHNEKAAKHGEPKAAEHQKPKAANHQAQKLKEQLRAEVEDRRRSLARIFEIAGYTTTLFLLMTQSYYQAFSPSGQFYLVFFLTHSSSIIALVLLFFVTFFTVLAGETPLVVAYDALRTNQSSVKGISIESLTAGGNIALSLPDARPPTQLPVTEIDALFLKYLERSDAAVDGAKRRPNALLFVGTVIAFVGLVFFILTLPGSRYGFLDAIPALPGGSPVTVNPPQNVDLKSDFWSNAIQLLPRLLMLAFIQVLAGFFLRQYRSSMEDFRYYEGVLRYRESQYISYRIRKDLNDKTPVQKFADDLLKDRQFGTMTRSTTTATLEAQRVEANEFLSFFERVAAFMNRTEKQHDRPQNKDPKSKARDKARGNAEGAE